MKKLLVASAAAALITSSASAQVFQDSVAFNLEAEVSLVCGVAAPAASTSLDFNDLANIEATTAKSTGTQMFGIACNDPDGATFKVTSTNGGVLLRDANARGAGNEIPYTANITDYTSLIGFPAASLATPKVTNLGGSEKLRNGTDSRINFNVKGVKGATSGRGAPTTTVFAGDYTDTVTLSLTAN